MRHVWFTTSGWLETPGALLGDPTTRPQAVPTVVAVCEKDNGDLWLVDAGWGARACEDPSSMGQVARRVFGPFLKPGDDIASKLRNAGLRPERVTTIVATHLHLDHVGGVLDFPNAELVATHAEMSEALRRVWDPGYRRRDIERVSKLRLVYLEDRPSMGFSKSLQLDDDVVLLEAPGHTLGHVAVLIRQREKTWIHAGDAAYVYRELKRRTVSPLQRFEAQDARLAAETQKKLVACERDQQHPVVVLTHDAARLHVLPPLPGETFTPPV